MRESRSLKGRQFRKSLKRSKESPECNCSTNHTEEITYGTNRPTEYTFSSNFQIHHLRDLDWSPDRTSLLLLHCWHKYFISGIWNQSKNKKLFEIILLFLHFKFKITMHYTQGIKQTTLTNHRLQEIFCHVPLSYFPWLHSSKFDILFKWLH